MINKLKKNKRIVYGIIALLVLMIGVLAFRFLILDEYRGKISIKNVESYSTVLSADVSNLTGNTNVSEGYDTVKYTIKYTLDNPDNILRNVVVNARLSSSEAKYARFNEIKGSNITSEVSEDGIIVNLSEIPTNEEQELELELVISNAPYGFKVRPNVTVKEETSDEKSINMDEIIVSTNSIEGNVIDQNGNTLSSIELALYEGNNEVKRTYTNSEGEYVFGNLDSSKIYNIILKEDVYKKVRLEDRSTSTEKKVIDVVVKNVDPFNLEINKYITKLELSVNGKKETYTYADEVKVLKSIKKAKTIEGSITYKITVKNTGEINGTIGSIQDIIPEGLSFNSEKNPGWEKKNGKLYYRVLEDVDLTPYEERAISLTLDIVKTEEAKTYINEAVGKSSEYKNVTFLIDGVIYKDINVLSDETIKEEKVDSDFSGWYTDPNYTNKYNFKNKVTKNMILYGSLTSSKCKVTFIDNGSILKEESIDCGTKVSSIDAQGKTGYTFKYWALNNQEYDFNSLVTTDTVLESYYEIINFNITYTLNGGTVEGVNPLKYTVESDNITLINPTKEGHTFTGWTGSNGSLPLITVVIPKGSTGDKNYEANFTVDKYKLYIDPNGGSYEGSIGTVEIEKDYASVITLSTPSRTGYTFTGWTLEGKGTLSENNYTFGAGNGRLTASYEPISYDIDYVLNGGSVSGNPDKYTVESSDITLVNPTKKGYTFTGWTGTDLTNPSTNVTIPTGSTGNRSYTANYTINNYTLTVDPNGGEYNHSVNPIDIANDYGTVITLDTPSRTGYTFTGWTLTGKGSLVDNAYTYSDGNGTVTANYEVITYNITYEGLTDAEITALNNPTTYTVENSIVLTNPQNRVDGEGDVSEVFTGWTYGETTTQNVNIPAGSTGNKHFKANFTHVDPDTYIIDYELNGGTVSTANPTTYTIKTGGFTLNNPSKDGYTFAGWTGTGLTEITENVTIPARSTGNRSYEAHYTPINYTITYNGLTDAEKNALGNPTGYNIESDAITLANPTREGYIFAGWTGSNGDVPGNVTIPTGSIGNKTYTAHFVENGYEISYELNGGSVSTPNPISYTVESDNITLNNPTKDGYTFAGWTGTDLTEPTLTVTIPTGSTGNREYEAHYNVVPYNITYGGLTDAEITALNNPTGYNIETETFTLNNPTREGYTFTGWTGSNGTNPGNVTIPTGTTGDKEYTANFVPTNYNISYDLHDGTVSTANPTSYTIESDTITLNNPTKRGYAFLGWTGTDVPSLSTNVTIPTGSTGNRSYEAHYSLDNYTITYHGLTDEEMAAANNPTTYSVEDNTFNLNNPTREGYTFIGWTGSNGTNPQLVVTIDHGTTGNKEYTANFDINTYTVTYKNGESTFYTDVVEFGNKTTAPNTNPVKSHSYFTHWSLEENGEPFDFDTEIVANTTLYAVFGSIEAPTISHAPITWTNDKVLVNVTSSHNDYEYYYKIGDGEYTKFTTDFEVDHNTTVYAYSTYGNGTSEEVSHQITNIDKIDPSIESTETSYVHTIDLDMTFLDNESGVKAYRIYLDNVLQYTSNNYTDGLNEEKNEVYTLTNLEASTSYTYRIELEDVAGNVSEYEKAITTEDALFIARVIGMGGVIFDDESQYVLFESLQDAIDYCSTTQCTIQLIPDEVVESVTVSQDQEITLDLDGKTLSSSDLTTIENNGNLTIIDNNQNSNTGIILNTNSLGTAIVNNEVLTVGKDDETVSTVNPHIEGVNIGIDNQDTLRFYDGKVRGNESVRGEVSKTPYSYNATIRDEGNKEIMILQIVEEPEARIKSKYYTKLANAIGESKTGTLTDEEEKNYLSQIVQVGDYGFIYNPVENSIISETMGINGSTALSMLELDLTDYDENQFLSINYSISSETNRDYGYVTILENEGTPQYNQEAGRIIVTSGLYDNNIRLKELEAGKKYYIYFGYMKDGSFSSYDDYFKINSLILAGKGSIDYEDMSSYYSGKYVKVDNYQVVHDLSNNADSIPIISTQKYNIKYNRDNGSLDYNNIGFKVRTGISAPTTETVEVEFSTNMALNNTFWLYCGTRNEKISMRQYNGVLIFSSNTSYQTFKTPSDFNDGKKHRLIVTYDNGVYTTNYDGNPLEENGTVKDSNGGIDDYSYVGKLFTGSIYKVRVYDAIIPENELGDIAHSDNLKLYYDFSTEGCVTTVNDRVFMPESGYGEAVRSYLTFDMRENTEPILLYIDVASFTYNTSQRLSIDNTNNETALSINNRAPIYHEASSMGIEKLYNITLEPGRINYIHFSFDKHDDRVNGAVIIKDIFLGTPDNTNHVYEKEKINDSQYYFNRYNRAIIKDLAGNNDYVDPIFNRYDDATHSLQFIGNVYEFESGLSFTNEETVDFEFSSTNTSNKIFYMGNSSEKISVGVYNGYLIVSTNSTNVFTIPSNLFDGSKHRITVSYKYTEEEGNVYKSYIDGTELPTSSRIDRWGSVDDIYSYIGGRKGNGYPYYGSLYNLKIYDKTLTPDEIDLDVENDNLKLYYNMNDSRNIINDQHAYINNNHGISNSVAHSYLVYDLTNAETDQYISIDYTISSQLNNDIGYITVTNSPVDPGYDNTIGRVLYTSGEGTGTVRAKLQKGIVNYVHLGYRKNNGTDTNDDSFIINSINMLNKDPDTYTINQTKNAGSTELVKIPRVNELVDSIELLKDITIDYTIKIPAEKEVVIDLNGHRLQTSKTDYIIDNSGKLTIEDGKYRDEASVIHNDYLRRLNDYNDVVEYIYEHAEDYNYKNWEFAYTGEEQTFTAPATGNYNLEVWGAQGGSVPNYVGGYGGYSKGTIKLEAGETIYINVGGEGTYTSTELSEGGYNGGGSSNSLNCASYGNRRGGSGGGATSISKVSGELKDLDEETDKPNIIIVAGGGGGSQNEDGWIVGAGGHAGGYLGNSGYHNRGNTSQYATGGSQISGGLGGDGYEPLSERSDDFISWVSGSFGQGGSSPVWECGDGGGGGGGFYGGGGSLQSSGAGGSGYIGNESLTKKKMVCYNCSTSNEEATKTVSTTCTNENPTADCSKQKNGYARITINTEDAGPITTLADAEKYVNNEIGMEKPTYSYDSISHDGSIIANSYSAILNNDNGELTINNIDLTVNKEGYYKAIVNQGKLKFGENTIINVLGRNNYGIINETIGSMIPGEEVTINTNNNDTIGIYNLSVIPQSFDNIKVKTQYNNNYGIYDRGENSRTYNNIDISGAGNGITIKSSSPATLNNITINTQRYSILFDSRSVLDLDQATYTFNNSYFKSTDINIGSSQGSNNNVTFNNCEFIGGNNRLFDIYDGNYLINNSYLETQGNGTIMTNRTSTKIKGSTIISSRYGIYNGTNNPLPNAKLVIESTNYTDVGGASDEWMMLNYSGDIIIKDSHISSTVYTYGIFNSENASVTINGNSVFDGNISIAIDNKGYLSVGDEVKKYSTVYDYDYTGSVQEFIAPKSGNYRFETWGASGGNTSSRNYQGGKGAYTSGDIYLEAGTKLYVYVGEKGLEKNQSESTRGAYNGSSFSGGYSPYDPSSGGGGATDISISNEENAITYSYTINCTNCMNNHEYTRSVKSYSDRIMVAGAGGGAGLASGEDCTDGAALSLIGVSCGNYVITDGTQTSGTFGHALYSGNSRANKGAGYFSNSKEQVPLGGTSYISGYAGSVSMSYYDGSITPVVVDGVPCQDGTTDVRCSYHPSGYIFTNTVMKAGYEEMPTYDGSGVMKGNFGNGHAKITLLDEYTTVSVSNEYPKISSTSRTIYGDGNKSNNVFYFKGGILEGPIDTTLDIDINGVPEGFDITSEKSNNRERIYLVNNTGTEEDIYQAAIVDSSSNILGKYATIQEAVDASTTGLENTNYIILLKDIKSDYNVTIPDNKNIDIDYRGHYYISYNSDYAFINNGKLRLKNTVSTDKYSISYGSGYIYNNGNAYVKDLNIVSNYNLDNNIINNNVLTLDNIYYKTSINNQVYTHNVGIRNNENATLTITEGQYYVIDRQGTLPQITLDNYGTATISDALLKSNGNYQGQAYNDNNETATFVYNHEDANLIVDNIVTQNERGNDYDIHLLTNYGEAQINDSSINVYRTLNHGELLFSDNTIGDLDYTSNNRNYFSTIYNFDQGQIIIDGGNYYPNIINNNDSSLVVKSGNIKNKITNNSTGSISIEGGTVEVETGNAIECNSASTITLGVKGDGNTSITSPKIKAPASAVFLNNKDAVVNFYDGIAIGQNAIIGVINETEVGYSIQLDIDNGIESKYLVQAPIIKNLTTGIEYLDITTAFADANNNDTLQLMRNSLISKDIASISNSKTITLDLYNYTLEVSNDNFIINSGNLTIIDSKYDTLAQGYNDGVANTYNSMVSGNLLYKTYDYSFADDTEQVFIAPYTGTYKLSAWGASGGTVGETKGGYGSYSEGEINLTKGERLYINVGGKGATKIKNINSLGGYNGGGFSGWSWSNTTGAGGGATSIATKSGLLSTLSDSTNDILIVSGGGGGAAEMDNNTAAGGSAGGIRGVDGVAVGSDAVGKGGTQAAGGIGKSNGSFGKGADSTYNNPTGAGGGAGFYGGGAGFRGSSAGGGSSYIGNSRLTNKSMYCYNCDTSDDVSTKTVSVNSYSKLANDKKPKEGDGYARITLISTSDPEASSIVPSRNDAIAYANQELDISIPETESLGGIKITSLTPIVTNNGSLTIRSGKFYDIESTIYKTLFSNNGTMLVDGGVFEKQYSEVAMTERINASIIDNTATLTINSGEFKNPEQYKTNDEKSSALNTAIYNREDGVVNITGGSFNSDSKEVLDVEKPIYARGRLFYNYGTINVSNINSNYSSIGKNFGTLNLNDVYMNHLAPSISWPNEGDNTNCQRYGYNDLPRCNNIEPTVGVFTNTGVVNINGGTYITNSVFIRNENELNINNNTDNKTVIIKKTFGSNETIFKRQIIRLMYDSETNINNTLLIAADGENLIKSDSTGDLSITNSEFYANANQTVLYSLGAQNINISGSYLYANNNYAINKTAASNITIDSSNVISKTKSAIQNTSAGSITLGTKSDGNVSITSPLIQGATYGIYSNNNSLVVNLYDGILKGKTKALEASITDIESGYAPVDGTESIDGSTYKTKFLDKVEVVQNTRTLEKYFDLSSAFGEAQDQDTLKMINNFTTISTDEPIEINDELTLDLNGFEIDKSIEHLFINNGILNIVDNSNSKTGLMYASSGTSIIHNYGELNINGSKLQSKNTSKLIINETTGIVNITNNSKLFSETSTNLIDNYGEFNVEDSTIENDVSATNRTPVLTMVTNRDTGIMSVKNTTIHSIGGRLDCGWSDWFSMEAFENFGNLTLDDIHFIQESSSVPMTLFANRAGGVITIENTNSDVTIGLGENSGSVIIKDSNLKLGITSCYDAYASIYSSNSLTIEDTIIKLNNARRINISGQVSFKNVEIDSPGQGILISFGSVSGTIDNLNIHGTNDNPSKVRFEFWDNSNINIKNSNISSAPSEIASLYLARNSIVTLEDNDITSLSSTVPTFEVRETSTLNIKSGNYNSNSNVITITRSNSTVNMGTNDSTYDPNIVTITADGYGAYNTGGTFNYYDGTIYGKTDGHYGAVTSVEDGYRILTTVDGDYKVSYLSLVGTTEAVAESNGISFDSLQTAINYAVRNNTYVTLVSDLGLAADITATSQVDLYLNGYTISYNGYIISSNVNVRSGSYNPSGSVSRILGNILGIDNKDKMIIIYEMDDGTTLSPSVNYRLYLDNKLQKVDEKEAGTYNLGSSDEVLKPIKGRIYIGNVKAGNYKLVGSDNKEISFIISEDGNVTGNVKEYTVKTKQYTTNAKAELVLSIQTGIRKVNYMLIAVSIIAVLSIMFVLKRKSTE